MTATRRFAAGFTLMEVMVVLVLIGIITSFAVLSVSGGSGQRLAEEAQRLAKLIELHQQEAILSGELRGIRFNHAGYTILSLSEKGQWQTPAAAALTQRQLPEDMTLDLWVEGRPVNLKIASEPQVALLNSGESTEFVVVFSMNSEGNPDAPRQRVAGDGLGRLTLETVTR
jgi:general secretion pathway protein H